MKILKFFWLLILINPFVVSAEENFNINLIPHLEKYRFNQNQIDFLKKNGFVLVKKSEPITNFYDVYKYNLSYDIPNYVTIDSILHTTSKIIHRNYYIVEKKYLYPAMSSLIKILYDKSLEYYKNSEAPLVKKAALDNCSFFAVGLGLLNINCDLPAEIKNRVTQETDLIRQGIGVKKSPIFQIDDDYSFYQPRGYYKDEAKLSSYYQAREWFSRKTFIFGLDTNRGIMEKNIWHNMRCSLLIYLAINEAEGSAKKIWEKMNQLYSLFSITSGNYNFYDYDQVWFKILKGQPSIEQLSQNPLLETFLNELKFYRKYNLYPSPPQFSLFSLHLSFNQYLLSSFKDSSFDFVEIMSVFDPSIIKFVAKEERRETWDNIKDKTNKLEENYWFSNLEIRKRTWDLLFSSLREKNPLCVDKNIWTKRFILTAIGSWTEMTEGSLVEIKSAIKAENPLSNRIKFTNGFIEPYPKIYRAEAEVVKTLLNKLTSHKLLSENSEDKLNRYINLLEFLAKLAEKEIEGKNPINSNEYITIWKIGYQLKELSSFSDGYEKPFPFETENSLIQISLIGQNRKGQNIEAGLGNPIFLYVIIPDGLNYNIACGPVYSYYEFTLPSDKSITNSDWAELINKENFLTFPVWIKSFIYE